MNKSNPLGQRLRDSSRVLREAVICINRLACPHLLTITGMKNFTGRIAARLHRPPVSESSTGDPTSTAAETNTSLGSDISSAVLSVNSAIEQLRAEFNRRGPLSSGSFDAPSFFLTPTEEYMAASRVSQTSSTGMFPS